MRRYSLITFFLLFSAALFIAACSPAAPPTAQAAPPAQQQQQQQQPAVPVQVSKVQTGSISLVFNYAGNLQAKQTVSLIPGATGRIESVPVEVGAEINAGDPIAIIKHDTYDAQLKQAEAVLAQAKLNLTKMQQGSRPTAAIWR